MASIEQILGCRKRWLDAVSSGQPPAALVDTTLRGCREAVAQLGSQLTDLAYPVNTFLLTGPPNLDERVGRIEGHTGVPVPKIVREFWRIVCGLSGTLRT